MKLILRARLTSRESGGLTLDCGDGAAMRIVALADDLVRVTALRGGEVRQKRTWADRLRQPICVASCLGPLVAANGPGSRGG